MDELSNPPVVSSPGCSSQTLRLPAERRARRSEEDETFTYTHYLQSDVKQIPANVAARHASNKLHVCSVGGFNALYLLTITGRHYS